MIRAPAGPACRFALAQSNLTRLTLINASNIAAWLAGRYFEHWVMQRALWRVGCSKGFP
jgi:hypothetical protein